MTNPTEGGIVSRGIDTIIESGAQTIIEGHGLEVIERQEFIQGFGGV